MILQRVGEKLRILEYEETENIAASIVKSAMQGEMPWLTVISGRNLVFQDDFGTRLEYTLGEYDGSYGFWRATRVQS